MATITRLRCVALILAGLLPFIGGQAAALDPGEQDYELKLLGKYVFFDKISNPPRMACVSCHDPRTGGTGSNAGVNLHQVAITGANPHTVGNLKPPTNAYASFIGPLSPCSLGAPPSGRLCGGNFWDGRAEGRGPELGGAMYPATASRHIGAEVFQGSANPTVLGYSRYFGPTSDQALNPMPNPAEQNIERQGVCLHVARARYAELYELAWGEPIDCSDRLVMVSAPDALAPERAFDISFKRLMLAVGAWQHSAEVNSFSSKRDVALRAEVACAANAPDCDPAVRMHPNFINSPGDFPLAGFTDQENLGHDLFYNTITTPEFPNLPRANCAFCHSDTPGAPDEDLKPTQLYADHAYHNIGTPANPELPAAPAAGIGGHTGGAPGFFKTPTMRNVDKRHGNGFTKAYSHNGWFKSLESIVHFYNTAAVKPRCPVGIDTEREALANDCWPAPEHEGPGIAIPFLLGDLGMTPEHEAALVAYMKTLTDGVTATAPPPYHLGRPGNARR